MTKTTTVARVKVVLEVCVGTWGNGCALEQVYKQAGHDAVSAVARCIQGERDMRIVSTPEIEAVTTVRKS